MVACFLVPCHWWTRRVWLVALSIRSFSHFMRMSTFRDSLFYFGFNVRVGVKLIKGYYNQMTISSGIRQRCCLRDRPCPECLRAAPRSRGNVSESRLVCARVTREIVALSKTGGKLTRVVHLPRIKDESLSSATKQAVTGKRFFGAFFLCAFFCCAVCSKRCLKRW